MCANSGFYPLSDLQTRFINIASARRFNIKLGPQQDLRFQATQHPCRFSATMKAAAVPQPGPLFFSACVCFRYCSSGNYRRWYCGLLHSAADVSPGTRLLPLPPTQRQ